MPKLEYFGINCVSSKGSGPRVADFLDAVLPCNPAVASNDVVDALKMIVIEFMSDHPPYQLPDITSGESWAKLDMLLAQCQSVDEVVIRQSEYLPDTEQSVADEDRTEWQSLDVDTKELQRLLPQMSKAGRLYVWDLHSWKHIKVPCTSTIISTSPQLMSAM